MRRAAPLLSFLVLLVLAALQLGGSCVDGVTPDCSDAAECGPVIFGDAATSEGGTGTPPSNDAAPVSDASEAGDAPDGGG